MSIYMTAADRRSEEKTMVPSAAQCQVPLWKKYTLTVREAAQYFHIGEKKIRQLVEEDRTQSFVLMVGNRAMIKRKQFEAFIDRAESL